MLGPALWVQECISSLNSTGYSSELEWPLTATQATNCLSLRTDSFHSVHQLNIITTTIRTMWGIMGRVWRSGTACVGQTRAISNGCHEYKRRKVIEFIWIELKTYWEIGAAFSHTPGSPVTPCQTVVFCTPVWLLSSQFSRPVSHVPNMRCTSSYLSDPPQISWFVSSGRALWTPFLFILSPLLHFLLCCSTLVLRSKAGLCRMNTRTCRTQYCHAF